MSPERIAVTGAHGFVGSAVARALSVEHDVVPISVPRLRSGARSVIDARGAAAAEEAARRDLVSQLHGSDVLVNAAGDPDASSTDADALFGANAVLPALLLAAAAEAGVKRFVHVSSAVVQNDKSMLDSSEEMDAFSAYSASKVLAEEVLRSAASSCCTVVRYRPPSVHAPGRRVTSMIARIAGSPAATVARPADQPTPQALLANVASAVAFLATTDLEPPAVVHHPWEGVTVRSLMQDLSGGRTPLTLPRWFAQGVVRLAKLVGGVHRPTAANARRIELLWLGQDQAASWLSEVGWRPPVGRDGWRSLTQEGAR